MECRFHFRKANGKCFRGLHWKTCLMYIADIILFAEDFDSHIQRLDTVLEIISSAGLKISQKQCNLFLFRERLSS